MNNFDKKILIISHNPLSSVNNNGKTLVSIFKGVPEENIYQIYLNSDIPDYSEKCHYLQINERQIIKTIFRGKNMCCQDVIATPESVSSAKIGNRNFANHIKRLLREFIWMFPFWKSKLSKWLQDKHFDVVFFMAGDGLFAYDVYRFVMNHTSSKGCLFFTDDYILGRTSRSPFASLRQVFLKNKMKKTLSIADEMYVISEEMRKTYGDLFDKEGHVIRNFSIERNDNKTEKPDDDSALTMVYAGGLHYNRWKVLSEIAVVLKEINKESHTKCCLKIYSSQKISDEIVNKISVEGASEFLGGASASEIADIYAKADVLLHVESFDKKAIASTKYSFSTKIPEYLSAGKCVLAVGPSEVASMRYLVDCACVISDYNLLLDALTKLVIDKNYRENIAHSCEEQFQKDFTENKQKECLAHILKAE